MSGLRLLRYGGRVFYLLGTLVRLSLEDKIVEHNVDKVDYEIGNCARGGYLRLMDASP